MLDAGPKILSRIEGISLHLGLGSVLILSLSKIPPCGAQCNFYPVIPSKNSATRVIILPSKITNLTPKISSFTDCFLELFCDKKMVD